MVKIHVTIVCDVIRGTQNNLPIRLIVGKKLRGEVIIVLLVPLMGKLREYKNERI